MYTTLSLFFSSLFCPPVSISSLPAHPRLYPVYFCPAPLSFCLALSAPPRLAGAMLCVPRVNVYLVSLTSSLLCGARTCISLVPNTYVNQYQILYSLSAPFLNVFTYSIASFLPSFLPTCFPSFPSLPVLPALLAPQNRLIRPLHALQPPPPASAHSRQSTPQLISKTRQMNPRS